MPNDTQPTVTTLPADRNTARSVKDGCYLIRFIPANRTPDILFYEGTMRVLHLDAKGNEDPEGEIRASGDLYSRLREFPYGRDRTLWLEPYGLGGGSTKPATTTLGDPVALAALPDPAICPDARLGIPIFPRSDYCHYLEVTKFLEGVPGPGSITVRFQVHEFSSDDKWPNPGSRIVVLDSGPRPKDFPAAPAGADDLYCSGQLIDEDTGQPVGELRLGWLSPDLRRARIVIDKVDGSKAPGNSARWQTAFEQAGWRIELVERNCKVADGFKPAENRWTVGELHNALLQAKAQFDAVNEITLKPLMPVQPLPVTSDGLDLLDREWCYHLLCVPLIEGFDRGVLFDTYGSDSNNVPREGAAVAAKWEFKEFKNVGGRQIEDRSLEKRWGDAAGKALENEGTTYFRVAVHEIGHAMGLDHNFKDDGFMNTTDSIADDALKAVERAEKEAEKANEEANQNKVLKLLAEAASEVIAKRANDDFSNIQKAAKDAGKLAEESRRRKKKAESDVEGAKFPKNVIEGFHPEDLNRLRFGPDVTVRPGTSFDDYGPMFADGTTVPADGLELEVSPMLEAVPLGAPVRIHMRLKNISGEEREVPKKLSFGSGTVNGRVLDPDGNDRSFWPVRFCMEDDEHEVLPSDASSIHSITLLRGPQKTLFPMEGTHRIRIKATWKQGKDQVCLEQDTTVRITPPVDEAHRAAAFRVMSTPDTLLSLAIGGVHLSEGNATIHTAISNSVLGPHFAIVEAKLLLSYDTVNPSPAGDPFRERIRKACSLINENTVLSSAEIGRLEILISQALARDEESVCAVSETVRATITLLIRKTDRLFLEDAIDARKSQAIKRGLGMLCDSVAVATAARLLRVGPGQSDPATNRLKILDAVSLIGGATRVTLDAAAQIENLLGAKAVQDAAKLPGVSNAIRGLIGILTDKLSEKGAYPKEEAENLKAKFTALVSKLP